MGRRSRHLGEVALSSTSTRFLSHFAIFLLLFLQFSYPHLNTVAFWKLFPFCKKNLQCSFLHLNTVAFCKLVPILQKKSRNVVSSTPTRLLAHLSTAFTKKKIQNQSLLLFFPLHLNTVASTLVFHLNLIDLDWVCALEPFSISKSCAFFQFQMFATRFNRELPQKFWKGKNHFYNLLHLSKSFQVWRIFFLFIIGGLGKPRLSTHMRKEAKETSKWCHGVIHLLLEKPQIFFLYICSTRVQANP